MSKDLLQKLFRYYESQLLSRPHPLKNHWALYSLTRCRTRDLGVSVYQCKHKHKPIEQYHSCRHQSCYICAQKARLKWIDQQKERLLDCPHFHDH